MATETTEVSLENMSLDQILGTPGAESVLIPTGGKKEKPNMFSREVGTASSFIDTPTGEEEEEEEETGLGAPGAGAGAGLGLPGEEEEEEEASLADLGQPGAKADDKEKKSEVKINKTAMLQGIQSLIDKGAMQPFTDDKPLKDYTIADMTELIEANLSAREKKIREEFPQEFFGSLPEEFQYAVEYLSKGGNDMKGLFRALAGVEETRQLDPTNASHQELIVRQYLRAKKFGSEEDITEEIDGWKDRGELEAKAAKFKPSLDKMQEEVVTSQLANQEQVQRSRAAAARAYGDSIYKVLEPGDLNGIKLDKKTQSMLYAGLVQPNYPSISGQNTNLLGHLLEKYQYTKDANHGLIAEALYLLADPEGYRTKIREQGQKTATTKAVRELKTEQASGKNGLGTFEDGDEKATKKQGGLPRMQGFFQRRPQ